MFIAAMLLLQTAFGSPPPIATTPTEDAALKRGELVVRDTGSGMTAEQMQQAAHPFFSEFDPPGNGLGLTLVRLVAELHGGRLAVLANDPDGSVCQIWIPRGAA